ncbi:MAG: ankyrin repeat domain-containing protein [Phycisphaerales bacterium]|nr:ankyrin repeat domain-containing protein [Phycisphaerales bacterium]
MAQRSNSVLVAAAILVAAAVIGYAVFSRKPPAQPTGPAEPPPTGDTSRPAPATPDPDDAVTVIDQTTDTTHAPATDATQDPGPTTEPNAPPATPPATLVEAADRGDLAALSAMLGAGADPNGTDDNGRTALMAAAGAGHVEAVFALLNAGADLNTRDKARRAARDYALARYDEAGQTIARVLGEAAGPPPVQDPGDK